MTVEEEEEMAAEAAATGNDPTLSAADQIIKEQLAL